MIYEQLTLLEEPRRVPATYSIFHNICAYCIHIHLFQKLIFVHLFTKFSSLIRVNRNNFTIVTAIYSDN